MEEEIAKLNLKDVAAIAVDDEILIKINEKFLTKDEYLKTDNPDNSILKAFDFLSNNQDKII